MTEFTKLAHIEGEDLTLMARPEANGLVLARAQVSTASIQIFEAGNTVAVYSRNLALTADPPGAGYDECMFAVETVGAPWPKAGGLTFFYIHQDSEYHLDALKTYKIVVTLTTGHASTAYPQLDDYGKKHLRYKVTPSNVAGV